MTTTHTSTVSLSLVDKMHLLKCSFMECKNELSCIGNSLFKGKGLTKDDKALIETLVIIFRTIDADFSKPDIISYAEEVPMSFIMKLSDFIGDDIVSRINIDSFDTNGEPVKTTMAYLFNHSWKTNGLPIKQGSDPFEIKYHAIEALVEHIKYGAHTQARLYKEQDNEFHVELQLKDCTTKQNILELSKKIKDMTTFLESSMDYYYSKDSAFLQKDSAFINTLFEFMETEVPLFQPSQERYQIKKSS